MEPKPLSPPFVYAGLRDKPEMLVQTKGIQDRDADGKREAAFKGWMPDAKRKRVLIEELS